MRRSGARLVVGLVVSLSLISAARAPAFAVQAATAERPAAAAGPVTAQRQVLWHEATTVVPTRIFFPRDFDASLPHTLVVALHGYGSSAEAFSRVADELTAEGFIVAVPQAPYAFLVDGRLGFDWTLFHVGEDELADRAALPLVREYLPSLVRDIEERYSIEEVYSLGFSQGAVLALATAIWNHGLYAGAISFGLPDYRPGWLSDNALASGRDVAVLLLHGNQDDRAPFSASEAARDHLSAAGYDVTLHGFTGGHSVPSEQLGTVSRWIRERQAAPAAPAPEKPRR